MLTSAISVQSQSSSEDSMLALYRRLGLLRKAYKALGEGDMTPCAVSNSSVGAWYRSCDGQKLLVVHNFGGSPTNLTLSDDISKTVFSNGSVKVNGVTLSLGSYSSVVFQL